MLLRVIAVLCAIFMISVSAQSVLNAPPPGSTTAQNAAFDARYQIVSYAAQQYFNGTLSRAALPLVVEAAVAFWWAFPLVITSENLISNGFTQPAQMNSFIMQTIPNNASYNSIVTPNVNVLYGPGFFDLSAGPMVLSVPATHGRYYVCQLMDFWGNTFGTPGFVNPGTNANRFFLHGPSYKQPIPTAYSGKNFSCSTAGLWIMVRMEINAQNASDVEAANKLMAEISITPFSARQQTNGRAVAVPTLRAAQFWESFTTGTNPLDFWKAYNLMVPLNPPPTSMLRFLANFTDFNITSRGVNLIALPKWKQFALAMGSELGWYLLQRQTTLLSAAESSGLLGSAMIVTPTGWSTSALLGTSSDRVALNAVIAYSYVAANPLSQAIYWNQYNDACNNTLVIGGSYMFNVTSRPPYNAFWSVTTYNAKNFFLIPSYNNTYSLGSDGSVELNSDGGALIYLLPTPPAPDMQPNWLPLGDGTVDPTTEFYLIFRIYAPQDPQTTVYTYSPPAVVPVDPKTLKPLQC